MKDTMNEQQKKALSDLNDALHACTDTDLFDSAEAWDYIGPDVINAFCDGVSALIEARKAAQ